MQTLIFDFDGTIANTFDAALRIANELAPEFGYRPAPSRLAAHEPDHLATVPAELLEIPALVAR